jgi:hypothetical protein
MEEIEIIIEAIKKNSDGEIIGKTRIKVIEDWSSEIESQEGEVIKGKEITKSLDNVNGYVLDSISCIDK